MLTNVLKEHPDALSFVTIASEVTLVAAIQVIFWIKTESRAAVSSVQI